MADEECEHLWVEIDIACDTCGDHRGLFCDVCWETLDFVFAEDPRQ